MKRVFITGIGTVTPVGNCRSEFWRALTGGRSGIAPLTKVHADDLAVKIGGEVKGLDRARADVNDKVSSRKMDDSTVFAVVAAREAIADADLRDEHLGDACGCILGGGLAGLETLQKQTENLLAKGPRSVSPFTIPLLMPNAAPANVSMAFGLTGTSYTVASACASSGHAMVDAFEMLRRGGLDRVVTGGTESPLTRLAISAFANMRAMTKKYNDDPTAGSRPFDADRDGFVMSEGATVLVFETQEAMNARGATPYAEMVGWGATMDAHHIVQPDVSARQAVRAMRGALDMAGWDAADIAARTYVNAHGTSTHFNDLMETNACKEIFGDHARSLRISSTKSVTGHMIGAACGTEMAACALALKEGVLPPTINYTTPDPECDLDYIPNEARTADCEYALNNTFGFGGHNVCVALKKA